MFATGSKVVRDANKATSTQLQSFVSSVGLGFPESHDFRLVYAGNLRDHERSSIWTIVETNMQDLFSCSSFGWDPAAKLAELFDTSSRFILVQNGEKLVAFAMFRFEYENYNDLIYCYELQVLSSSQRAGLGRLLLRSLENIGTNLGMDKLILTVLKDNTSAMQFYNAFGFQIDATSPGYMEEDGSTSDVEDVDYEILSKALNER